MFTNMLAITMLAVFVTQVEGASVTYEIDIRTGDRCYSATDANAYIIIYGEDGDTGKIMLTSSTTHKDPFEKSNIDKFIEEGVDVGKLTKISIGHDNSGRGAEWYVEDVVIKIGKTTCEFTFNLFEWLANRRGWQGQLERDVNSEADWKKCDEEPPVTYQIDVKTGDVDSAGTAANVYIIIYGEKGDTGKIVLRTSATNVKFEKSNLDKFTEKAVDVGKITKIRIGHDNRGPGSGWYLDDVVIKVGDTSNEFTADQWLEGDTLYKDLYIGASTTYEIDVKTGSGLYSGTEANVYIIIYGEDAKQTAKIMLTSATNKVPFGRSNLAKFNVEGIDVGKITKIRIGHDNTGDGPGWYLDAVVIKIGDKICEFNFNVHEWLQDENLHKDLSPDANGRKCEGATVTYKIDVKTGDVHYAGTDAKVYIIIYGEKGDTGKIILKSPPTEDMFERNELDEFKEEAVDVGKITKIRIGHDDSGSGSGWYLDKVVIAVGDTSYKFTADEWLQDDALDKDLYPSADVKKDYQDVTSPDETTIRHRNTK